ncbi:MAG TPA: hypothetical protein VH475_01490 [Tepidisphaeraceae bacterium]|jgi:hypothetical protein
MHASRWAAICTLAVALIGGCQNKTKPVEAAEPGAPTPDQVAAAKSRYEALGDRLVGVVEAVDDKRAAVSGIDTKAVQRGDVVTFIDVNTNQPINNGTLFDTSAAGRLIIDFDQAGARPPRPGDLCVKLK